MCWRSSGSFSSGRSLPSDEDRIFARWRFLRHCEERLRRSNPVFLVALDCFASLAMTSGNVGNKRLAIQSIAAPQRGVVVST
ncbi:hypothetical protein YH63_020980 [Afipia massiliensis]|uniref:Uncharacterized protein n=1 Tax=Afipia massiliensis TaxID=211460 RepID=A0A4U6BSX8_9BRAD|nr:hypothetical protein YH63_020980 [Afipia massiliensis]